ncbi:DUF1270 family protein [Staphylococcus epidermidis]|uniref:DUF1270 family protein n=1 Tax=Staphylococcus epidermidis TaxID=1282 RepID=UPI000C1A3AF0|nr:DUF1270 family protein [Staphylococcus epidermidis]PIH28100.1 hypothetical protein CTI95_00940 [Staphylococcus epidermidis]
MDKIFLSFVIANLVFITMSIALQILGFYFTTAIGSAALLAMVTFIYLDKYFFQEIKKLTDNGN